METIFTIMIFVLIMLFAGVVLYSRIKLEGLKQVAIDLIVAAEKQIEKGKNNEKFMSVISQFKEFLPPVVRAFVSEDMIIRFIQSTFDSIKEALDTKPKVNTIQEEIKQIEEEIVE